MATFEYQKIQWTRSSDDPIFKINELAKQGWRVVAGGGSLHHKHSKTKVISISLDLMFYREP
jgi:hypothetical protein